MDQIKIGKFIAEERKANGIENSPKSQYKGQIRDSGNTLTVS